MGVKELEDDFRVSTLGVHGFGLFCWSWRRDDGGNPWEVANDWFPKHILDCWDRFGFEARRGDEYDPVCGGLEHVLSAVEEERIARAR